MTPLSLPEELWAELSAADASLTVAQNLHVLLPDLKDSESRKAVEQGLAAARARVEAARSAIVWASAGVVVAAAEAFVAQQEAAEQRPVATTEMIEAHAEKQDRSYADAWRYFEREGYDMDSADGQYS